MRQNLSLVTLGVEDLTRSRGFYAKLGWKEAPGSSEHVVFYECSGIIVGLFPRTELAKDAMVSPEGSGFSGFSLSHNVASEKEVDSVIHGAESSGGVVIKKPEKTFWGGYSGYFSDPDGFLWEVAHNPFWDIDSEGRISIPQSTDANEA